MSEPLPDEFRAALAAGAARRGPFGDPAVFLPETPSTNDVAMAMAEAGAPEGAIVMALAQTAGRGRLGREWVSPPGAGLYISIVCRNAAIAPMLTLAGGVAVALGIRRATGLPVLIKWPNDIVIPDAAAPGRRRKLAGILAEASTGGQGLQHVVLGVGINLKPADYPPAVAARASALETELGRPIDAPLLLTEVLAALNEQVTALAAGDRDQVLNRWRELAPSAIGARVEWSANGAVHRGTTMGLGDDGALLVRIQNRVEHIISGELTWL